MRILEVGKLYPPFYGGIEKVVHDISSSLKKKGYKVEVLCTAENNKSSEETIENIKIYRCASFAHVASTYLSYRFINIWKKIRNEYDVIHIHLPNPLALLAFFLFQPKKNIKIIVHWHSDVVKKKFLKIFLLPLQKFLLNKCNKIIASTKIYVNFSKDLKKYKKKIEIIPIGIDHCEIKVPSYVIHQIYKKYKKKFIIFSLGRHVYYKGFEFLIESARYLNDEFLIILGGEGKLTKKFKSKISQYNLFKKVELIGKIPVEQISGYFSSADVFCLPSIERSESYGIVQLEAMMHGVPIVSTDIKGSGVSWVNKHGITGLVVPIKNPIALASSFNYLRTHPIKKDQIKNYFFQNYTSSKMMNSIIRVIESS